MTEFKCDSCSKSFNSKESLNQHYQSKHSRDKLDKAEKNNLKKYFILAGLIIAIGIIALTFYVRSQKPGQYDELAKCLTEKGAIIYGNDFCQYTAKELNFFGNSEKYLNYVKCSGNKELCDSKSIKITPTWEINGKMYEGVQGLEKLAELSGCKI